MPAYNFQKGEVLLFNKPLHWTSFDLVKKIRNLIGIKKVGHAGTLDPLATGLMIICTGSETKNIESYQAQEKEYTGSVQLGITTPSYDLEQEVDKTFPYEHVTPELLKEAVQKFTGKIQQLPPPHSAVKVNGKRAYELARKGKTVDVKPREVEVREFEITAFELPHIHFRIVCSKGTYIRSIAHDLGKELGSGGCLTSLCRTRIGNFKLEDAITPSDFENRLRIEAAGKNG